MRVQCVVAALLIVCAAKGCSILNKEGPEVGCADLEGGKINACKDDIIAYCHDGVTVEYRVCTGTSSTSNEKGDVCDRSWQEDGRFRCENSDEPCFGCNF